MNGGHNPSMLNTQQAVKKAYLGKELPSLKGAGTPMGDIHNNFAALGGTRERSIAATVAGSQLIEKERSLERNPSVLSRKELIKQEYNLLLETRLPKIMQLMNSEKSLGLGIG
jgi:hypothetical protein